MIDITSVSPRSTADTVPLPIGFANIGALDAFARQRVTSPVTLFDSTNEYNALPVLFSTKTVGGGAVSHLPAEAAVGLSTGAGATDKAIRQTLQYFRYQPGKSQLILLTGTLGPAVENTVKRLGYFDDLNGLFFQVDSGGLKVVQRSNTSGIAVDIAVSQANFNIDTINGLGPSRFTIDLTKANIFVIDFEWLGVGSVRFGVYGGDGTPIYFHQFKNANANTGVYMRTPNLPVRAEISNTAVSAGGAIKMICASVISEGGFEDERGYFFTASTPLAGRAISTTPLAVLGIRPKTTFNSIVNRGYIVPDHFDVYVSSADVYYEVLYKPATATGGSWVSADANSIVEYNNGITAFTGGIVIDSGFLAGGGGTQSRLSARSSIPARLPICLDIDGANPINLLLVITCLTGSGTGHGAVNWKEIY